MKLADIVQGTWLKELATAIPAIPAIPETGQAPSIATIATIAVANPAELEPVTEADPFPDRRERLQRAGLSSDEAALMAFKLERRDMEGDDRRLCIECAHLSGSAGLWRCSQWRQRQHNGTEIPSDLVTTVLHRCVGFEEKVEAIA